MKNFISGVLIVYIVFSITSCPQPGNKPDVGVTIPREFWGDWVALTKEGFLSDNFYNIHIPFETTLSITQNTINGESVGGPNEFWNIPRHGFAGVKFERLNSIHSNLVYFEAMRHFRDGYVPIKLYLVPKFLRPSSFTGSVVSFDNALQSRADISSSRAVSGIGGIQVVINNLDRQGQTITTRTDDDGNFTVSDIIPGDSYEVRVGDQTIQFTPVANGDNMGTITITDGVNFKTTYSGPDVKRYVNRDYPITIYMNNTGTARAAGTTYRVTLDDGLTSVSDSSVLSGIMGTVEPGRTGIIQMTVRCDSVQGEYEWKRLHIEIHDPLSNRTWNDSISILFHSSSVIIELYPPYAHIDNRMDHRLSFFVISPDGENYAPGGIKYDFGLMMHVMELQMEIPLLSGDYMIVVQGREGVYELSDNIRGRSPENASQFTDTGRYKPNQTATQATTVQLPIMAFMIKDTFDFYMIRFK